MAKETSGKKKTTKTQSAKKTKSTQKDKQATKAEEKKIQEPIVEAAVVGEPADSDTQKPDVEAKKVEDPVDSQNEDEPKAEPKTTDAAEKKDPEHEPAQARKKRSILRPLFVILVGAIAIALTIGAATSFYPKEKSVTYAQINDQPNLGYKTETTVEIIHDDKFVTKIKTNRKIETTESEKLSDLINAFSRQYDMNNVSYSGYKYTISNIDDTHAEINSEIDYTKLDMGKYLKDNPAMKEYTEDGKMTIDGAEKMYEKSGYSRK